MAASYLATLQQQVQRVVTTNTTPTDQNLQRANTNATTNIIDTIRYNQSQEVIVHCIEQNRYTKEYILLTDIGEIIHVSKNFQHCIG